MENEVVLRVDGLKGRDCEEKITRKIAMIPGIEMINVSAKKGLVSVTGGDIDQLEITDIIESFGYKLI